MKKGLSRQQCVTILAALTLTQSCGDETQLAPPTAINDCQAEIRTKVQTALDNGCHDLWYERYPGYTCYSINCVTQESGEIIQITTSVLSYDLACKLQPDKTVSFTEENYVNDIIQATNNCLENNGIPKIQAGFAEILNSNPNFSTKDLMNNCPAIPLPNSCNY